MRSNRPQRGKWLMAFGGWVLILGAALLAVKVLLMVIWYAAGAIALAGLLLMLIGWVLTRR